MSFPRSGRAAINWRFSRGLQLTTGYSGLIPASSLDRTAPVVERLTGINWRGDGDRWTAATDSMPRARLVAIAQPTSNIAEDLLRVDIARVALVDQPLDLSGTPGIARVLTDRPGQIGVETTAEGRQLLVLTERYSGGWQATVDGNRVQLIRVYADFIGCVIEKRRHIVEFTYDPASVRAGLWMTLLGTGLTLLVTILLYRDRRR